MQSQVKGDFFLRILTVRGIATGWTGVDMSTSLLPEGVPGIDADPMLFRGEGRGLVRFSFTLFPTLIRGSACCSLHIFRPGDAPVNSVQSISCFQY